MPHESGGEEDEPMSAEDEAGVVQREKDVDKQGKSSADLSKKRKTSALPPVRNFTNTLTFLSLSLNPMS